MSPLVCACVCSCGRGFNKELLSTVVGGVEGDCLPGCPQTSPRECRLEEVKGIEVRMYKTSPIVYRNRISASAYTLMLLSNIKVAHTFYLGTKYSSLFGANFSDHTNRERYASPTLSE